jgi:peptidoglycan/xylan/chitin deacetylase (PgdA/CDA1 family)
VNKRSLKNAFYVSLYYSGVIPIYRWMKRRDITFVMVHGVMSPEESDWQPLRWQLDPKILDRYLARLSKLYEFIPASEAIAMMRGEIAIRPNCLVFTIDDGYRNALTHMWPILDKYHIRPLLFVPTRIMSSTEPFWFDQMDYWVQKSGVTSIDLAGEKIPFDHSSIESAENSFRQLMQATRRRWADDEVRIREVDRVIDDLKAKCGANTTDTLAPSALKWVAVLDVEGIKNCQDLGFEIGSHSENHYRLTHVSPLALQSEVQSSKQVLENVLDQECQYFGYPEGSRSENVIERVRDAGYKAAFSSESVGIPDSDTVYDIPRVHFPENANDCELVSIVSGFSRKLIQFKGAVSFWMSAKLRKDRESGQQLLRGQSD